MTQNEESWQELNTKIGLVIEVRKITIQGLMLLFEISRK